jgi:hypothetical protein
MGVLQELIIHSSFGVPCARHVAAEKPFMSLSSRTNIHLAERMTSS